MIPVLEAVTDSSEDDGMGIPEATEDGTQDNYEEITETPEGTDSYRHQYQMNLTAVPMDGTGHSGGNR